jgi:pyruvate dehydrogenase E2 component (dihydrolipoamide acetyltransferase)
MPIEIVMPKLGLTMASGTIARWIKRPGETVREGEPLVEVSTDKIAYEVESPATGTVARAVGGEGDEFACGEVIGLIALAGESETSAPQPARIVEAPRKPVAGSAPPTASERDVAPASAQAHDRNGSPAGNGARVIASPAARRLARERDIALGEVRGTGPRGRITLSDVHAHEPAALRQAQDDMDSRARGDVNSTGVTLSRSKGDLPPHLPPARRAIFRKMTEVALLPLAQVETVARVDAVKALIDRRGDFGWTAFAAYAVARLLREHVELRTNATTGAAFGRIDVGVAADTPHGLIVPVVRDAATRTLAEIQREIVRLAALARDGTLSGDDVGGACFSISNVGPQRVERVAPLPDPPQTAILGIGAATQRPAVVDGALVPAWMLTCVVSFDHRFIDGAPAARFLAAFANACADPGALL